MPLTCTPDTLTAPPAPDEATMQRVDAYSGAEALAELAAAAVAGSGGGPTGDGLGVLVRMGTAPAGGGWFAAPAADGAATARIVALGVLPAFADLGLDALVAAELARLAFRAGAAAVELEAGDEPGAEGRYAAAGFTAAG